MSGYKITDHFAQRIKSTILKVDAMPGMSSSGKIPVRFEDRPSGGGDGSLIRMGTYNTNGTQWEKGSSYPVHVYKVSDSGALLPQYSNGSPTIVNVLNLFVTIPPNTDRVRYCAFAKIDEAEVLIVAEC